jgi:hypothetical protein
MKPSAADRILDLLKGGPLLGEELVEKLPEFSHNTIRRARRDLVRADKIETVGSGRNVPYKLKEAAA